MRKKFLMTLMMLILALGLTACGTQYSSLEEAFESPLAKTMMDDQINELKEENADVFSDIAFKAKGNTVIYMYTFAEQIEDVEYAQKTMSDELDKEESIDSMIDDFEEEFDVSDVAVQFIYYNADGTEILNKTITQEAE